MHCTGEGLGKRLDWKGSTEETILSPQTPEPETQTVPDSRLTSWIVIRAGGSLIHGSFIHFMNRPIDGCLIHYPGVS